MVQLIFFDLPLALSWASILSVALLLVGGVAIYHQRVMASHGPQEPPQAPTSLPIVGHLLGLMRSKFNYYVELRYVFMLCLATFVWYLILPVSKYLYRFLRCHCRGKKCI